MIARGLVSQTSTHLYQNQSRFLHNANYLITEASVSKDSTLDINDAKKQNDYILVTFNHFRSKQFFEVAWSEVKNGNQLNVTKSLIYRVLFTRFFLFSDFIGKCKKVCPPRITNNPLRIFIELSETVKNVQTFFSPVIFAEMCVQLFEVKRRETLTIPIKQPIICLIFWPFFSLLVVQYLYKHEYRCRMIIIGQA